MRTRRGRICRRLDKLRWSQGDKVKAMTMPKRKRYSQMNAAELAAATRQYDQEWTGPGLPGRPLTTKQRATHRRAASQARAKLGRPKVGAGAKIVPISIERGLLKKA